MGLGLETFEGRGTAGAVRNRKHNPTSEHLARIVADSNPKQKAEAITTYRAELALARAEPAAAAGSGVPRLPRAEAPHVPKHHR